MDPYIFDLNFEKLAIISDIHSNAFALKAAIKEIRQQQVDAVICLGDLLTYGCQPQEVIELLMELKSTLPCVFIKGNHDQFYFDYQKGSPTAFSDYLPEFIRDSIEWTSNQLDFNLATIFDWQEDFQLGTLLFAHANPFEFKNWAYLDSEEKLIEASQALLMKEATIGCFGHTHRPTIAAIYDNNVIQFFKTVLETQPSNKWQNLICNPGSIGQPRGDKNSLMYIQNQKNQFKIWISYLDYDVENMLKTITSSTISDPSKIKLCSFFRGNL